MELYKEGEPEGALEDEFKVVSNVANSSGVTLNYCRDAALKEDRLYFVDVDDNLVAYDTKAPDFLKPVQSQEVKRLSTLSKDIESFSVRRDRSVVTISRKGQVQVINAEGRVVYSSR